MPTTARSLLRTMIIGVLFVVLATTAIGAGSRDDREPDRAPIQPVRMIAEWEPALGTLIRWPLGIPSSLVVELARDDTLYTLVETTSSENQARNSFQSWGVRMEHVVFIRAQLYSMWTRDWGPLSVFDGNGEIGITDPWFDGYPWVPGCGWKGNTSELTSDTRQRAPAENQVVSRHSNNRGYDEDDLINGTLADFFGWQLHQIPAYCTGGNIMCDGQGTAFSTRQMISENSPYMSEATFRDRANEYLGITHYTTLDNPEVNGIQHIDCYAKLLDAETVLIKQVPSWHPEWACVENLVAEFEAQVTCYGRPYRIVRVFCAAYAGDDVAAYTNSLILNRKVLVPTFGLPSDDTALQTYADAMPGFEIIGFDHANWYYYDALHCRTMGIFDPRMLQITHRPLDTDIPWEPQHEIAAHIVDHSESGLISDQLRVWWQRAGDQTWQSEQLVPTAADSFVAWLPGQAAGTQIRYYLEAEDNSGRRETLPRTAPTGHFSFQIDPASAIGSFDSTGSLAVEPYPNPSTGMTSFRLAGCSTGPATLEIFDLAGRRLRTLLYETQVTSGQVVRWDGCDMRGAESPHGMYLLRMRQGDQQITRRFILVR